MKLAFAGAMVLVLGMPIMGCVGVDDDPHGPFVDPDEQVREARARQALFGGTWPEAPDPGEKASAPITNLRDFPKLAGLTTPPRGTAHAVAAPAGSSVDVVTFETDGAQISMTIYDPAPGVSPEALAESLRIAGNQDVRLVGHEPGPVSRLAPNDCAFGQARAFNCPVSFWRNNGNSNPIVLFNDHSGSLWPVSGAVPKWNQVVGIDSAYRFNTCASPFRGNYCVDVYSGNYGASGWTGLTNVTYATSQAFLTAYVQLNDFYNPSAHGFTRNNVATHELGHVLGLGHNTWSGDVMFPISNMREDIGGENRSLLEAIYSVAR